MDIWMFRYIHTPAETAIEQLFDENESILILGSRLTAIDVALKLKNKKITREI
jgi:uncharacterized NAD(P)/FAD-binding protein YdhS